MAASKVYFTNLRTNPKSNLLDKLERLVRRAGITNIDFKDQFVAIKIHFGEPGNMAFIRPNYAARLATLIRELGAKPFLSDCNTLYSGRRTNAVDHLQSAMEKGCNPISPKPSAARSRSTASIARRRRSDRPSPTRTSSSR